VCALASIEMLSIHNTAAICSSQSCFHGSGRLGSYLSQRDPLEATSFAYCTHFEPNGACCWIFDAIWIDKQR
jgi:hypothetical protein